MHDSLTSGFYWQEVKDFGYRCTKEGSVPSTFLDSLGEPRKQFRDDIEKRDSRMIEER